MSVKITCIKKDNGFHANPHIAISELGWINETTGKSGLSTRIQIYEFIKSGGESYVIGPNGTRVSLITDENEKGTKFVKTIVDNTTSDNLSALSECIK